MDLSLSPAEREFRDDVRGWLEANNPGPEPDDDRELFEFRRAWQKALNERGWGYGNTLPDRITLFQKSIEDECEGDEDEIVVAIGETLIHELGHYFGMSEEQIMDIEERYWHNEPFPEELEREDDSGT